MLLDDFELAVNELVKDDSSVLTGGEMQSALKAMLQKYSADNPRCSVEDLAANGSYELDVPTGWQQDFSEARLVEYPIGQRPRSYVNCSLYNKPDGVVLEFDVMPESDVRLTFTLLHELTAEINTIPTVHHDACVSYAASKLCDHLAAYYANEENSTFQADTTDHQSKTQKYKSLANMFRGQYNKSVNEEIDKQAAGAVASWPSRRRSI